VGSPDVSAATLKVALLARSRKVTTVGTVALTPAKTAGNRTVEMVLAAVAVLMDTKSSVRVPVSFQTR
jgi:hypothetical protein